MRNMLYPGLLPTQAAFFSQAGRGIPSNVMNVDTKNKY